MRKTLLRLVCLMLAIAIIFALPVMGFAEGINNVIKNPGLTNSTNTGLGPNSGDIKATGDDEKITMPASDDYLPQYEYYYIDAPKGLSVYVYRSLKRDTDAKNIMPMGYKGTKVKVMAINSKEDMACVLYKSKENETRAGWIPVEHLSAVYPGESYEYGQFNHQYSCREIAVSDLKWSKTNFVFSKTKFSEFTQKAESVLSLTIDYQVTGRNGIPDASGKRNVYYNDGSGWTQVGGFDVNDDLDPVHYTINFDVPTDVAAVAVVPDIEQIEGFLFRLSVVDVKEAESAISETSTISENQTEETGPVAFTESGDGKHCVYYNSKKDATYEFYKGSIPGVDDFYVFSLQEFQKQIIDSFISHLIVSGSSMNFGMDIKNCSGIIINFGIQPDEPEYMKNANWAVAFFDDFETMNVSDAQKISVTYGDIMNSPNTIGVAFLEAVTLSGINVISYDNDGSYQINYNVSSMELLFHDALALATFLYDLGL